MLVILLRSGDALETAELREGDAQGPPGALHLHLDHQVSAVLKDEHPEPGGGAEYSLEGLMLKFQYFGHLMQRASSLEKTLMLGKIEDRRKRG